MIQGNETISSKDFNKGLVTRADLLKPQFDQSPNCMDIKWYFDGSIGKRYGSSTTNTVALVAGGGAAGFIVQNTLTNNLLAYWKMEELSGTRLDAFSNLNLNQSNDPLSIVGIRGQAANLVRANSQAFYINTASFGAAGSDLTISMWVYFNTTAGVDDTILARQKFGAPILWQWSIHARADNVISFNVNTSGANTVVSVLASSFGALQVGSWYNVVAWHSNITQIGISSVRIR